VGTKPLTGGWLVASRSGESDDNVSF
jgi:hypothetical protein